MRDKVVAAKLKCAGALAALEAKKYKTAAKKFTEARLPSWLPQEQATRVTKWSYCFNVQPAWAELAHARSWRMLTLGLKQIVSTFLPPHSGAFLDIASARYVSETKVVCTRKGIAFAGEHGRKAQAAAAGTALHAGLCALA